MMVVRDVFQAKYARGDELVALFKALPLPSPYTIRVLVDVSGAFYTVVTEIEVESLAVYEQVSAQIFSDPAFGAWFEKMIPLVESGRREFYRIVG